MFEADLSGNLYKLCKLWNRMGSGSYFRPPVTHVQTARKQGGVRVLGVPTVLHHVSSHETLMHRLRIVWLPVQAQAIQTHSLI
jgi:retron-type reverse transcriptase